MLPTNLTPLEVLDLGIHSEMLAFKMYEALTKRVRVATIQTRLGQLKKDEKDHRKTLKAHRRELFPAAAMTGSEEDAANIFGTVDASQIRDKASLIQAKHTKAGAMTQPRMNSRTVRPLEIRARNRPTKGENEIHHAQ